MSKIKSILKKPKTKDQILAELLVCMSEQELEAFNEMNKIIGDNHDLLGMFILTILNHKPHFEKLFTME